MKRTVQIVVLTVMLAACSWAVTVGLLPPPMASFTDANGLPLAGGLICTYAAGTSTPLATYTDATGTVANANPVILNASGRANIWLATNTPYKITVRTSGGNCAGTGPGGVLVTSTDNVSGVPPAAPILWSSSGTTMSNLYGYKVCISATSCTSSLALLNIQGTSVGGVGLLRIDDAGGTPGVDLYGASGVALGSYGADSAGLRLRTPGGISQMVVGSSGITVQNMSVAGATSVTVQGGVAQGSTNLLRFKDSAGTEVSYITPTGIFLAPRYNATATAYAYTFSNSNDLFLVDGYGDVTATGQLNVKGVNSPLLTDDAAIKVNGVKVIDNTGNATFTSLTCTGTPCGTGGGGSGTPGGSTTHVQYNNAGAFGGSANFIWANTAQLLTVTATSSAAAGIAVADGFMQADAGFFATTGTAVNYNAIQAPGGGMAAKSFTAVKYVQIGTSNGAPTPTTGDTFGAGALYWDTGTADAKMYNGAGWVSLATGGATTPGGSTTNIQYNGAGSFAGSGNFTWDNTNRLLTITSSSAANPGIVVGTGFVQADAGFLATVGTATNYNSIQAPGGGMAAKSFTATKYIQAGSGASAPTATTGDTLNPGALYWNTGSAQLMVYNGSTWASLAGSGGSPGGSNQEVQFNNSGGFGASANFKWDDSNRRLTILGLTASSSAISVGTGYIQADAGFLATAGTATTYNAVQAPGGGMYAKSFTALNYMQVGYSAAGSPTLTSGDSFHAGALYFNTALGKLQVYSGASWGDVSGSGGSSGVSSAAGSSGMIGVNGDFSGLAKTGAVTLTLPQAIATYSTPTFGGMTSTGTVATSALSVGSGALTINSAGAILTTSSIRATYGFTTNGTYGIDVNGYGNFNGLSVGSGNVFAGSLTWYGGYTVIDTARNASLTSLSLTAGILAQGNLIAIGGVAAGTTVSAGVNFAAAGQAGQTYTITIPGMSISGSGCTGGLYVTGGIIRGCF